MPARIITWDKVVKLCKELARKVKESGYEPDVVVAIARGGFVPARLLCDYLSITDLLSIKVEHWVETGKHAEEAVLKYPFNYDLDGRKVLIVDDICDTGDSVIIAKREVKKRKPKEVKVAVMQWISTVAKVKPDYYAEEIKEWEWQLYPWCDYEDKMNLIRRILKEEGRPLSLGEIAHKFEEYYGVRYSERELEEVLPLMLERGVINKLSEAGKEVYALKSQPLTSGKR